jgi:hypothetical protein
MVAKHRDPHSQVPLTNLEDLRLRKPRSDLMVGNAEAWVADVLHLPAEAVRLVLPHGRRRARFEKSLGALRRDWGNA